MIEKIMIEAINSVGTNWNKLFNKKRCMYTSKNWIWKAAAGSLEGNYSLTSGGLFWGKKFKNVLAI